MKLKDKIIVVVLIVTTMILISLAEEKPPITTIKDKQYIQIKEGLGEHSQVIIIPHDSIKQTTDPSHIHGEDSTGNYIEIDGVKIYGMIDSCNDSGCDQ
jgi:hypothetical protein